MLMRIRWVVLAVALAAVLLAAWDGGASALLKNSARGRLYSDAAKIPYRRVALVLGCARWLGGGQVNPFFENRMRAVEELYSAHKVDYIIVSGDNHIAGYDEPTDMKDWLVASGIPAEKIFCDYAGFHTLDSVVRVKEVFGQTSITVVSQRFHNQRAIFIARHKGIDAIGFDARDVNGFHSFETHCREQLSKMAAVLDVFVLHRRPKFLGEKVAVGAA